MPYQNDTTTTNYNLGIVQKRTPVMDYFTRTFFSGNSINTTDTFLDLAKMHVILRTAPFVLPFNTGAKVFRQKAELAQYKFPYIKLADGVTPDQYMNKMPQEFISEMNKLSPVERRTILLLAIANLHLEDIARTVEWMCAQAIVFGKIDIVGFKDYPDVTIDFGRRADHYTALSGGNLWSDANADILGQINDDIDKIRINSHSGITPNILLVSRNVWSFMRKNNSIKENMSTDTSNTGRVVANLGITGTKSISPVAIIEGEQPLLVVINSEYSEKTNPSDATKKVRVPYMPDDHVTYVNTDMDTVMAYGAIIDDVAAEEGNIALNTYQRFYEERGQVASKGVVTHSSPLPIVKDANETLTKKVL